MEVFEALGLFVTTLGGVSVVILGLSSYIGKIFADRYTESVKVGYQKEIEAFKKDLDLIKESSSRYSSKQFELYTSLYHSLYDLKEKGDLLWEDATKERLAKYTTQMTKTKKEVEKSYLFLETSHYEKFIEIFRHFTDYQIGKESLLNLIANNEINIISDDELVTWIGTNLKQKEEYSRLVDDIRKDLRDQLRGRR